jgi:hypothetical protein
MTTTATGPRALQSIVTSRSPRALALDVARSPEMLRRVPWPVKPPIIAAMRADQVDAMAGDQHYPAIRAAWVAWSTSFSAAVTENTSRFRGGMWAVRELRGHDDDESRAARALVEAILQKEWGLPECPHSMGDCSRLAAETVASLARRASR